MTGGSPRLAWFILRAAGVLVAFGICAALVGCEIGSVDRGGSFVADNRSDVAVLARIKSTVRSETGAEIAYRVVELPAASRLVIATQGFAGNEEINGIEVLLMTCESFGSFFGFAENGGLIRIDEGPTATIVREWPEDTEPRASTVDKCPSVETSPSP